MATIQGVYVALFGRPADPTGLAYFNSVTKNGADLNGIGDLASTQEYKDRFAGQNNTQIVNSIYQSLFGRDAEAAGLTFFVNALNNGTLNIKNIAIAILDGAQGSDKTVVTNKVAAADLYTKALDTGPEIVAYSGNAAAAQGRTFLSTVKDVVPTTATVDTAVAAMVTASNGGGTGTAGVTLTLGDSTAATPVIADFISPDQTNNAFKTTAGNDTIRGINAGDLSSADSIDGGAGTDTLNAVFGDNVTIKPVLKSVEIVNLKGGALATGSTIDFGDSTGVQKVTISDAVAAAGKSVIVKADNATSVTFANENSVALATSIYDAQFKNTSGSSDSATIGVSKVATAGAVVQASGIENLTLNSVGDSANAADYNNFTLKDTALKSLVVTGDHNLTIGTAVNSTDLKTVDASAFTGIFTYKATGNGETISGGTKGDVITLGAGNDTVVYKAANVSNLNNTDEIKSGDFDNKDKFDVKAFGISAAGATLANTLAFKPAGDTANFFKTFGDTTKVAVQVVSATEAWVYVDTNGNGNFEATSDLAIHVTGAVDTSKIDISDFIFS